MEENKKRRIWDKVLLGAVIGGAIGSVIGATVSKSKSREIEEKNRAKELKKSFFFSRVKGLFKRKDKKEESLKIPTETEN